MNPAPTLRPSAFSEEIPSKKYIDLHLHLDGSITLEIAKKLAGLQSISLPAQDDQTLHRLLTVPAACESLNDFLKCFALPLSLLQTPQGLREAVSLVAENIRLQGVIYAEIRFAPQLHTQQGMTQEEAVRAALEGLQGTKLHANLILCLMRGDKNNDENLETLRLAQRYLVRDGGVVALDLAGAEGLFPTDDYRHLFQKAHSLGIPFTIHAGEAAGPESVRQAVEFGADRIGHGVRIFQDPDVMTMIRDRGIPLEMCPTSNRQTHAVSDMTTYPLLQYLSYGIRVTLNTDDMGIEGTTLPEEFLYMKHTFGLTDEQEQALLSNAIDAAFTTDTVKEWLRRECLAYHGRIPL